MVDERDPKPQAAPDRTPPREPTAVARTLRASLWDGALFSSMVGLGEAFLPAFVLALGGAPVEAGLISTLPMLAGALVQLVTPRMVQRAGSFRRWVVFAAAVQALAFLPLLLGALSGRFPVWAAYAAASLYWAGGMSAGPPWNTLMGGLVPARVRASFFATRSALCQAGVFFGLLAGGWLLRSQAGDDGSGDPRIFALLFGLALLLRSGSAWFLHRHAEVPFHPDQVGRVGPLEMLRRAWGGRDGRLLLYMLFVQVAVQSSGPFFYPFMLRELGLDYVQYTLLIGAAFASRTVAMRALGRFARRFGTNRLLLAGGLGIVPVSVVWAVSQDFRWLLAVQVFSGLAWACYELSTLLLFFDHIETRERTSVLTLFNFANAVALAGGSLLGGLAFELLGGGYDAYLVLFLGSGGLRLASLPLLLRVVLPRPSVPIKPVSVRPIAVRPNLGGVDRPILAALEPEPAGADGEPQDPGAAGPSSDL